MKTLGCGCRPFVVGHRLFHRGRCPTSPNQTLSAAEASAWRALRRGELRDRASDPNATAVERGEAAAALLLRRDPAYVDAHIDDEDDDGRPALPKRGRVPR